MKVVSHKEKYPLPLEGEGGEERLILDRIVDNKLREVAERKKEVPLEVLKSKVAALASSRNFKKAISSPGKINIITEIKKSSPSAGVIIKDFTTGELARMYEENGASALSILTDHKFFAGRLEDLTEARKVSSLPILAKEFIVDEYQIYEARIRGADALLLIARILNREKLKKYLDLASWLDLECLVEIHNEEEWEEIKDLSFNIVGINNRNLANLKVNLETSFNLVKKIPSDKIIVSESGINNRKDIYRLRKAGVDAFLIGEALLKSKNVGGKLRELLKNRAYSGQ